MAEICKKKTSAGGVVTVEYVLLGEATLADGTVLVDGTVLDAAQYAELTTCPVTDVITKDSDLCYIDPTDTTDPKPILSGRTCVVIPTLNGLPDYTAQVITHFDAAGADITASILDGTFVQESCATVHPPQIQTCIRCINSGTVAAPVWEERKLHTVYVQKDDGTFDTGSSFVTNMGLEPALEAIADLVTCPEISYETVNACGDAALTGAKTKKSIKALGKKKK